MTETSKEDFKAINCGSKEKKFELMNYRGILAPYLVPPLINLGKLENTSQFELV